jgi:hypothetical protein
LGGRSADYRIARDGTLTQLTSIAATTVGRPIDLIVDADGNYLSVLTANGSIEHSYRFNFWGAGVDSDGFQSALRRKWPGRALTVRIAVFGNLHRQQLTPPFPTPFNGPDSGALCR